MERPELEDYLDGQLTPQEIQKVDEQLAASATDRRLLKDLRQERALRQSFWSSLEPDAAEARLLAEECLAGISQKRNYRWTPSLLWTGRIAALLALTAGSFWAGKLSERPVVSRGMAYSVQVRDAQGQILAEKLCSDLTEAQAQARSYQSNSFALTPPVESELPASGTF